MKPCLERNNKQTNVNRSSTYNSWQTSVRAVWVGRRTGREDFHNQDDSEKLCKSSQLSCILYTPEQHQIKVLLFYEPLRKKKHCLKLRKAIHCQKCWMWNKRMTSSGPQDREYRGKRVGGTAPWSSSSLVYMRPWSQASAPNTNTENNY